MATSDSPQTVTLAAGTVTTVTFTETFTMAEVTVVTPAANGSPVWVRTDGVDPVAAATGVNVVPGALGAYLLVDLPNTGGSEVRLMCAAAGTLVSVRGLYHPDDAA